MKIIRALFLRLLFLLIIAGGLFYFLVATNEGLRLSIKITNLFLQGTLTAQKLEGKSIQNLAINTVAYTYKQQKIILNDVKLKWHFISLFPLHITLDKLELNKIQLADNEENITIANLKILGDYKDILYLNCNTQIILPSGTVYVNFVIKDNRINGRINLGNNQVVLQGPINGPWRINANLLNLAQLHKSLEKIDSSLTIDATIVDAKNAVVSAKLSQGSYKLPKGTMPELIVFKELSLNAKLIKESLTINLFSRLDDTTIGRLQLKIPKISLVELPSLTQKITGKAQLATESLQFLDCTIDLGDFDLKLQNPSGKIKADIDISGVINNPKFVGNISLIDGKISLPDLGLTINPIELSLKTDGTNFEGNAKLKSNDGEPLILSGQGTLMPNFTGKFVLEGNNVILMSTSEYNINVSPNLTLTIDDNLYNIDGHILIPQARLMPISFMHTEKLTSDAVFEEDKKDPNPQNLNINIAIDLGKDVKVNVKGIQGYIDGMLNIKQLPKQALIATGKLQLRDGSYEAYGQKLVIEQGDIIFLGQQIDNPNIQVRATRKLKRSDTQLSGSNQLFDFSANNLDTANFGNQTTVGIIVTGRINSPKVKLFSSPPNVSQADILSMLILGTPADQVSKSGGKILIQAMSSMHLDSGGKGMKMMQDFKKYIGVDFDVQNNSLGSSASDVSKTSISAGKSITKRIYLQYNVGLFQENSSVFTLTYLLNKFLNIKVSASGVSNGIDFTYNHSD